jgi:hypothetical protein
MPYHLSERDLGLIQLEEFHAPSGYAEWFAALLRLGDWRFVEALHSVSAMVDGAWGETDLLAFCERDEIGIAVMVGEKIAVALTPAHGERDHARGQTLV